MDVTVYGPLRGATGEKTVTVDADPETVGDVIEAFVDAYPAAEPELYDGNCLRPSVRIAIDGDPASPEDLCPPDATVSLHPALRGG